MLDAANLVISTLHRTLLQLKELPPVLYCQLDGGSSNKCDAVLAYCNWLVVAKRFRKVKTSFLHVGHTHEDIDQQFSMVSKYLKKRTVWSPQELLAAVKASLTPTVHESEQKMQRCMLVDMYDRNWDVEKWLAPHIDTRFAQYRKECHVFRFVLYQNGHTYMHYKLRASTQDWYPSLKVPGQANGPTQRVDRHFTEIPPFFI